MLLKRQLAIAASAALASLALAASAASANFNFGSPLVDFGTNGIARYTPEGATSGEIEAMAMQGDGKILVAGNGPAPRRNWVARFDQQGQLDYSFASSGIYTFNRVTYEFTTLRTITWSPGGIYVGGGVARGGKTEGLLIKLDANGNEDPQFGEQSGFAPLTPTGDEEWVTSIAVAGGGIVTAGYLLESGVRKLAVHQFSSTDWSTAFEANAASALGGRGVENVDGARTRILQTGAALRIIYASDGGAFSSLALDASGAKQLGYGANGTASLGSGMSLGDAILRADGGIIFTGSKHVGGQFDQLSLAGVDANGAPLGAVGVDGTRTLNASLDAHNRGVGLRSLSDGDLYIVASATPSMGNVSWANTITTDENGNFVAGYGSGGVLSHVELNDVFSPVALELAAKDQPLLAGSGNGFGAATKYGLLAKLHGPNDIVPASKISSPKKSKIAAKKLKTLSGTATPAGSLSKVELALQRIDKKLLKKKKKCLWLSSSKAKFKQVKAKKKKCSTLKWLKAKGTSKWSYKLKKKLPRGSYVLSVRATGSNGVIQAKPRVKKFKVT